jgi:fatty acid desaturase
MPWHTAAAGVVAARAAAAALLYAAVLLLLVLLVGVVVVVVVPVLLLLVGVRARAVVLVGSSWRGTVRGTYSAKAEQQQAARVRSKAGHGGYDVDK